MYFIFRKFLFVVVKKVKFRSQSGTLSFFNAYEPGHEKKKTCLIPYENNKGADQPVHPRILISTFVVRCLNSIILVVAIKHLIEFHGMSSGGQCAN